MVFSRYPVGASLVYRWRRYFRLLVFLVLMLGLLWIFGRSLQVGLERSALIKDIAAPASDLTGALSALSLSLPAHVSACRATGKYVCPYLEALPGKEVSMAREAWSDLLRAREAAGRLLAVMARLESRGGPSWAVSVQGEACITEMPSTSEDDRNVVQSLCRFRERSGEYLLCLSAHPVLTERQCEDLMRLATVDTVFDCIDCGDRPSNVFAQKLEWRVEMLSAAEAAKRATQLASPVIFLKALELRVKDDVQQAVITLQRFADDQRL